MRSLLKNGLRSLIKPTAQLHPVGHRHATIIAVAAQKGGVGKTTTSVSLAAALAKYHGKRVLLLDLDPQGHVATALASQIKPGGGSLSAVLTDERQSHELMDAIVATNIRNLDVTPFDPQLAQTEDLLSTRIGKEFILRDALKITRTHYDVIVIDCPPNQGNLALNGLCAADSVMIPCDPSPLALKGVDALVQTISTVAMRLNPDIDIAGILLTRVDGRNVKLNNAVMSEIENRYGQALLPVQIGINSALSKAQMEGLDIFSFDEGSRGATQYRALADLVSEAI